MMDYEYEIFLSYRRSDDDWVRWTEQNLVRPLRTLLRPAMGDVRIFVDQEVDTGADWPTHLGQALARSRLLLPVLSRDYFRSEWCRLELALMYDREQRCGLRTPGNANGLILPFVIDDGDSFPAEIRAMQWTDIHEFANPWIRRNSPRQEAFTEHLRRWCPCVTDAISRIPPYDPAWETLAIDQFRNRFQIHTAAQTRVPGLSLDQTATGESPP